MCARFKILSIQSAILIVYLCIECYNRVVIVVVSGRGVVVVIVVFIFIFILFGSVVASAMLLAFRHMPFHSFTHTYTHTLNYSIAFYLSILRLRLVNRLNSGLFFKQYSHCKYNDAKIDMLIIYIFYANTHTHKFCIWNIHTYKNTYKKYTNLKFKSAFEYWFFFEYQHCYQYVWKFITHLEGMFPRS